MAMPLPIPQQRTKAHGQSVLYSTKASGSHRAEFIILLILLLWRHGVWYLRTRNVFDRQADEVDEGNKKADDDD